MLVLGIEVSPELVDRWLGWFAPPVQPFLVAPELAASWTLRDDRSRLTDEVRDTFCLYDLDGSALVWLSRSQARRLPASVRRDQPARHTWPHPTACRNIEALVAYVEEGRRPSRHAEVTAAAWEEIASILPGARRLGGTFPSGSGPNCFGAVMAACGVAGASEVWMLREPFEEWLARHATPGGPDGEPGTVLVWRGPDRTVQHAAITLGSGWALHKPSQGWMSPTKILAVRDLKYSARAAGRHLHRYHLR